MSALRESFMGYIHSVGTKEAAKMLETYPSIIKRWESGKHDPSFEVMERFYEKVLKMNPAPVITNGNGKHEEAIQDIQEPTKPVDANWNRECDWVGRELCVLFPCYKFTNPATAFALMAISFDIGKEKMRFYSEFGDAVISNTRNKLADHFLKSGATWSLWLDDDIVPPIGRADWFKSMCKCPPEYPDKLASQHVVHRLISHNKSVIGATYFGRQENGPPMFYEGLNDREAQNAAIRGDDSIRKCGWVATGCLLVNRQVFLDIQAKFPELAPVTSPGTMEPARLHWDFFRLGNTDGEDVAFCKRARAAGHEIYVDTGLQCAHVGYKAFGAWSARQSHAGFL